MPIPLPNLDDRRWSDFVDEGLALIPFYAPNLTDHNASDPFRTLVELLAWVAEMNLYALNRIPESHVRKFLALVGIQPKGPQPSQTVLRFTFRESGPLSSGGKTAVQTRSSSLSARGLEPVTLPSELVYSGFDSHGNETYFRTLSESTVVDNTLNCVLRQNDDGVHDLTPRWRQGETLAFFGEDPKVGDTLYLGFSEALPAGHPVGLYFVIAGEQSGSLERQRLIEEKINNRLSCQSPDSLTTCQSTTPSSLASETTLIRHHSVQVKWEFCTAQGNWMGLNPQSGEIKDETRAFTFNGRIVVKLPSEIGKKRIGQNTPELYYLRCRILTGAYESPPRVQTVLLNGVAAEQAVDVGAHTWTLAINATIEIPRCGESMIPELDGIECRIGQMLKMQFQFNLNGEIERISLTESQEAPSLRILAYKKATESDIGTLTVEALHLGRGTNKPHQELRYPQPSIVVETIELYTLEDGTWQHWQIKPDFFISTRKDPHFVLDPTNGIIRCGDGERGNTFSAESAIFAIGRFTSSEAGNIENGPRELVDSLHNEALLEKIFDNQPINTFKRTFSVDQPLTATQGQAREAVLEAAGQAFIQHTKQQMAVTLSDYEALALETPGVQLVRVKAFANLHPHFSCLKASGVVTLIVLPSLPQVRPTPSVGLCKTIHEYLMRRRVIGTRLEVIGPTYLEIAVRASVKACSGASLGQVQKRIIRNLQRFFHPIYGGSDGSGWPFGRNVYRSEVLQVIDETSGVDYVMNLELVQAGKEPSCGNICIGMFGLVASGEHRIEVENGQTHAEKLR